MERRLLSGVDKEELSAVIEVKLDEVKLWLIVVDWLLLRELSAPKVTLLHYLKICITFKKKNICI